MEGFGESGCRRDFAAHCGLDPVVWESHFVAISDLTGAEVGVCWCECHARREHVDRAGKVNMEDD